jgi:hypothetical protein
MPRSNPQRYIDQVAVWAGGLSLRCAFFYHVLNHLSILLDLLPAELLYMVNTPSWDRYVLVLRYFESLPTRPDVGATLVVARSGQAQGLPLQRGG